MILSILICSIYSRAVSLGSLLHSLESQIHENHLCDEVEILTDIDNKEKYVGEKRNDLIARAKGKFVVFIDDDDAVSENYCRSIVEAIKDNPDIDAIAIHGIITTAGENELPFYISREYAYTTHNKTYYRPPNHITPIRREIALEFPFLHRDTGEDLDWCLRIAESKRIKSEARIDEMIYHYRFDPATTETQNPLKRKQPK